MRFEPDLVRALLAEVENHEKQDLRAWSAEVQNFHLAHLIAAGLVTGSVLRTSKGTIGRARAIGLTFKGHQFLADLRNQQRWPQFKDAVEKAGGSASLDAFVSIATTLAARGVPAS